MNRLRNIIPTLIKSFLAVTLISLIFFHAEFHIILMKGLEVKYKKEIRRLIKMGVPDELIVKFRFQKDIRHKIYTDMKWFKYDEFRLDGKMYDIISESVIGDSVYFSCIHDVKESGLFARWESYLDDFLSQNPLQKNELQSVFSFYNYYYNLPEYVIMEVNYNSQSGYSLFQTKEHSDFVQSIDPPPPKTV